MATRRGARSAARALRAVLVLGSIACGASPPPPRTTAAPPPEIAAATPLCGPRSVGQPWPTPIPAGGVETIQGEGTLEGMSAGTALLAACGDRIAIVSCSVSLRAEESPFGHDIGTHVVERPAVLAADLLARIRRHLARDGFAETWAGGGTLPQLEALAEERRSRAGAPAAGDLRMGVFDAAFLAAGGARAASIAARRGADERIVVVGCGAPGRCTLMVIEAHEACDAPGGLDGARLGDDDGDRATAGDDVVRTPSTAE